MNDEQLRRAMGEIREFAVDSGLEWVLDEVDDLAVVGVVEEKRLRESRRDGRVTYEEIPKLERTVPGRPRAEEFVTRRPMSVREQVDTLVDALERVLVDVERIASASVVQLQTLPGPNQPEVHEIDFIPDLDDAAQHVTTEELRHRSRAGWTQARLRRLREALDE